MKRGEARTLLVASAGGHFEELRLLRERFGVDGSNCTWVTWDTPQTRSLLGDEPCVFVERSQPRDLRRVLADSRVAQRILRQGDWRRVVSTGSIVAVPFLATARRFGVGAHYIESAARVNGPSLSARILERLPGVNCYGQSGSWAYTRSSWRFRGSVFDAFEVEKWRPRELRRVVVTLGTSRFGFPRLVRALRAALPSGTDVVWQLGPTTEPQDGLNGQRLIPQRELSEAMREADLVIAHAGVGSALEAMKVGQRPVLVPRRASLREHVDDHQFEIAANLANRGLAAFLEPEDITTELLVAQTASRVVANREVPPFSLVEA